MNPKIEEAIKFLREQGAEVDGVTEEGKDWFQVDFRKYLDPRFGGSAVVASFGPCGRATPQEMEDLADGAHTLSELWDLWVKRIADEKP